MNIKGQVGEYITNEEATMLHTIKAVKKIPFSEMAEKMGMKGEYLSKILHGKRRIPVASREAFDDFIEKYRCELIIDETHTQEDIPDKIWIQNDETGDIQEIKLPQIIMENSRYRRSSAIERESVLRSYGMIPLGYSLVGTAYELTNYISVEDWNKVQILFSRGVLTSKAMAELLGVTPQYWSRVVGRKVSMPLSLVAKLHMLLNTYESEFADLEDKD